MKPKSLILAALCMLFSISLLAQSVEWGVTFGKGPTDEFMSIGLGKDRNIVALKTKYVFDLIREFRTQAAFHILGQDGKQNNAVPFVAQLDGRKIYLEKFLCHADKCHLMFHVFNSKTEMDAEYVQQLNPSTLQPIGAPKKLAEYTSFEEKYGSVYSVAVSPDSSKVLLTTSTFLIDHRVVVCYLYDADFNLIHETKVKVEGSIILDMQDRNNSAVDNQGNIYVWGNNRIYDPSNKKAPPKQVFLLYSVDAKTVETKQYTAQNTKGEMNDFRVEASSPQYVYGVGTYKGAEYTSIKGVHLIQIDKSTWQVVRESSTDFGQEICQKYVSEREQHLLVVKAKGGALCLQNYLLRDLVAKPEGGVLVLLEQFEEIYNSNTNGRMWDYNNIVVVSFGADGALQWTTKIPKWQRASFGITRFASFAHFFMDGKFHILYNLSMDNLDVQFASDSKHAGRIVGVNGCIVWLSVDESGKLERKILTEYSHDIKMSIPLMEPANTLRLAPNKLLITASDNEMAAFGTVTF